METREVLEELGFQDDWQSITDKAPAYRFDFGNLDLTAAQVTGEHLRPEFLFTGVWRAHRSIGMVESSMPLEVESYEQGVAWIAYMLRNAVLLWEPDWLKQGCQWSESLPWERRKKAYRECPRCEVQREWFSVASRKLRKLAAEASPSDVVSIHFDGEMLKIRWNEMLMVMPATGKAWLQEYQMELQKLTFLPQRLKEILYFSVWDGCLTIGNRVFQLLPTPCVETHGPEL